MNENNLNTIIELLEERLGTLTPIRIGGNRIAFDFEMSCNDDNYEKIQNVTEKICYYIEEQDGVYLTDYEINVEGYSSIVEVVFE